jgi:hypothetical protein
VVLPMLTRARLPLRLRASGPREMLASTAIGCRKTVGFVHRTKRSVVD